MVNHGDDSGEIVYAVNVYHSKCILILYEQYTPRCTNCGSSPKISRGRPPMKEARVSSSFDSSMPRMLKEVALMVSCTLHL